MAEGPSRRVATEHDNPTRVSLDGTAISSTFRSPATTGKGSVTIEMPSESSNSWATWTLCVPTGTLSTMKTPLVFVKPIRVVPRTNTVALTSGRLCTLSNTVPSREPIVARAESWAAAGGGAGGGLTCACAAPAIRSRPATAGAILIQRGFDVRKRSMCIDKVCLEWRLYTGGKGSLRLRRKMADRSPQGNAHFGPRRDTPTGAVWVWRSASGSGHRHGSA